MVDIDKIQKKINVSYARYLKFKRADRYSAPDELSFAEKHSKRVVAMKKFILRMVILLVILLIVMPIANKNWIGSKISFKNDDANIEKNQHTKNDEKNNLAGLPVMLKPNFFGNDDNGQPFNISADSGVSISEEKIVLTNLKANMALKDSSRFNVISSHGDYLNKEKRLVLNSGVVIVTENGYKFITNSAIVKMNENMATGSEKVRIKGDVGDIDAKGFIIRNSGEEIVLFGGINLRANIDESIEKINGENKK